MTPYVGNVSQQVSTGKLPVSGGAVTAVNAFASPQDSNTSFNIQFDFGQGCGDSSAPAVTCPAVNSIMGSKDNPMYINTINFTMVNNVCTIQSTKYCNADKTICQ